MNNFTDEQKKDAQAAAVEIVTNLAPRFSLEQIYLACSVAVKTMEASVSGKPMDEIVKDIADYYDHGFKPLNIKPMHPSTEAEINERVNDIKKVLKKKVIECINKKGALVN